MLWTASGPGAGMGWFWAPIMMVGCLLMMVMMMGGMMRHGGHPWPHGQRPASAEQHLADRLARGEIDVEQYNRLLAAIRHHD